MNTIEITGGTKQQRDLVQVCVEHTIQELMPRMRTLDIEINLLDIKGDATDPCKETVHMTKAQDLIEMGAKTPGKREPITNIQYSEDVDEESNNVCQSLTKDGDLKDDTQNDVKGSLSYTPSNTEFEEDTKANNFADRRRRSP